MNKIEEREKLINAYPSLITISNTKDKLRIVATKNIRIELKQMFPDVKFSIKSRTFANGDAIDVSWEYGPQVAQVRKTIEKYQYGEFDGRSDTYTHKLSMFNDLFGGVKYVSGRRKRIIVWFYMILPG